MSLLNTSTSSHSQNSTRNSSGSSLAMPLSRLFSRRSNDRSAMSDSSPSSLTSAMRSLSIRKSGNSTGSPSAAPESSSNSLNPFSARPSQPTRRPQSPAPPVGDEAPPPAYTEPISETTDDPYAFLLNFDTIFLIDDSGSMAGRSWRETSAALAAIAPICTARDKDGVDVHFLNHRTAYRNLTSADAVDRVFKSVKPMGGTPTGTRLHQLLKPYLELVERELKAGKEPKPLNVIVITDGVASDDVESVVLNAAKKLESWDAPAWQVGVQFFQVGREPGAAQALQELDDGLVEVGCPRDIVDTVPWNKSNGEQGLSADGVLKVVLGSVNRRLDRKRVSGEAKRVLGSEGGQSHR